MQPITLDGRSLSRAQVAEIAHGAAVRLDPGHVLPLLLGDGTLLFDRLGQEIELQREEVQTASQETSLRFSVVRPV